MNVGMGEAMTEEFDYSRLRILVIEDNNLMTNILRTFLRGFGIHNIQETDNAISGFEELQNSSFDIILVDNLMNTFSGIEFTRAIRTAKDSPNCALPIIMISGHTEKSKILQARDAGVNEFIGKPLSAQTLISKINEVLFNPRQFKKTAKFVGPDRRRRNPALYSGVERRAENLNVQKNKNLDEVQII